MELLIAVLVIIVAAAGWFFYDKAGPVANLHNPIRPRLTDMPRDPCKAGLVAQMRAVVQITDRAHPIDWAIRMRLRMGFDTNTRAFRRW